MEKIYDIKIEKFNDSLTVDTNYICKVLNLSKATIYQWIRKSNFPARKTKYHWCYSPYDVMQWLNSHPDFHIIRSINQPIYTAITAIDLFCGAGGCSEGLIQAGFHILFSSDISDMVEGIKKAHFVMGVSATPEGRWLVPLLI